MGPPVTSSLRDLRERLPELMLRDQHRLRRRIDGARKIDDSAALESVAAEIATDIETAEQRVQRRGSRVPQVGYPVSSNSSATATSTFVPRCAGMRWAGWRFWCGASTLTRTRCDGG